MESKLGSASFGKYLQSIRLEKRIPLEAVSKATRIGIENLLNIENEALERLPAEVLSKDTCGLTPGQLAPTEMRLFGVIRPVAKI